MSDTTTPTTGYAPVNGLDLYYEIHGEGRPTLLLHGAYGFTGLWGELLPGLAAGRRVIAVDLQGHGRTADVDRPIRYEPMADDCAALLDHLGVDQADIVGYSMGANVALRLAIQHPDRVRRQVILSGNSRLDAYYPEVLATIETITAETFAGSPVDEGYRSVAPRPEDFPRLVAKLVELDGVPFDWADEMAKIRAATLIVAGDADAVRPEHGVELLRALGGGIVGEMVDGSPKAQLAILPNTAHIGVIQRTELLLAIIPPFLDAPDPVPGDASGEGATDGATGEARA